MGNKWDDIPSSNNPYSISQVPEWQLWEEMARCREEARFKQHEAACYAAVSQRHMQRANELHDALKSLRQPDKEW